MNSKNALFLLVVFLFSCGNNESATSNVAAVEADSNRRVIPSEGSLTNTVPREPETISCDSILWYFVRSTNLPQDIYLEQNVDLEVTQKDTLTIRIFGVNDMKAEVPLRWLKLVRANYKLYDITDDPDEPQLLTRDSTLAERIFSCVDKK